MNTFENEIGNVISKPMLTEPGVKYFLNETLKQCHKFKEIHQNMLFNIGLLVGFFIILGILLLYKYKGKLTPEEIEERELEKKRYILSKIRNYQDAKLKSQQELITGLPHWDNEFDIINDTPLKKFQKS
jgi:septal ring-binding cell division protein DamX